MCLGFTRLAYAQQIGIDAPNSIHTNQFASISLVNNCTVQNVTWQLDGGTIINSYNNNTVIDVQWTTAGYKYISASLIQVCNGQQQTASAQTVMIQVTQALIPPITISGRVTNPCGIGVRNVTLQGFPTTITTNNEGYYTTTVPYGWSGSVSAVKSPIQFTPSQSLSNVTTDQVVNFSVVGGSAEFTPLTANKIFSSWNIVRFGSLVPGYSYTIVRYDTSGNIESSWTEIADYDIITINTFFYLYPKYCIYSFCGSQTGACTD